MPATADVVNFARARRSDEFGERFDQIETVNVIADLFGIVAEDPIGSAAHGADHEVREKAMQLGAGVRRTSEATATK